MTCISCAQGFYWECGHAEGIRGNSDNNDSVSDRDVVRDNDDEESEEENNRARREGPRKRDASLKDQQSTGRKRAAVLYPLDKDAYCEWRGKKNCGGGLYPLVGCIAGKQQARHHGPDKNTLNNDDGNVHRICHECHNRWHYLNNPDYQWEGPHASHEPVAAEVHELAQNIIHWATKKVERVND